MKNLVKNMIFCILYESLLQLQSNKGFVNFWNIFNNWCDVAEKL